MLAQNTQAENCQHNQCMQAHILETEYSNYYETTFYGWEIRFVYALILNSKWHFLVGKVFQLAVKCIILLVFSSATLFLAAHLAADLSVIQLAFQPLKATICLLPPLPLLPLLWPLSSRATCNKVGSIKFALSFWLAFDHRITCD